MLVERLRQLDPRVGDALLAAALACIAELEVALDFGGGHGLASALAALGICAAVAWRRRAPLGVLLAIVVIALAASPLGSVVGNDLATPFAAFAIAVYTVGAELKPRPALAGIAIALCAGWALQAPQFRFSDLLFATFTVAAPWLVGRAMGGRRALTAALAERAQRVERERDALARLAVAEERARIARELHDVLAHSVSVMVVQAEAAEEMLALRPERARHALVSIQDTGRDALGELRRLLGVMRRNGHGAASEPQPQLADIEALAEQIRRAGLTVVVAIEGPPQALPAGVELAAYRVVQEALTNVLKHADAGHAQVAVRYMPGALEVEITDNGRGAGAPARAGGHGLVGMRERVALYRGELVAGGRPEGGYRVRAWLPFEGGRR